MEKDGEVITTHDDQFAEKESWFEGLKFGSMIQYTNSAKEEIVDWAQEAIKMNMKLTDECPVDQTWIYNPDFDHKGDPGRYAENLTARGVAARLTGASKPAMSLFGSGSQGIAATLPVYAYGKVKDYSIKEISRSTLLSFLVTMFIKSKQGRLSPVCGTALAAGAGSACAIVYLSGGGEDTMESAIANIAGDLTGIICDGASFGCSLKAGTGANSAIKAAELALNDIRIPRGTGVVGGNIQETISNLGNISNPGMVEANDRILSMMASRKHV